MAPDAPQVARERTVVRNPTSDDPNAGIIVAAGDPIPAGSGIISNTPNKVDAAANFDTVDAADRAKSPTPATRVVSETLSPEAQATRDEIAARVEENRNTWVEGGLGEPVDRSDVDMTTPAADTTTTTTEAKAPADMTVGELDAAYGDVDGYPKSGNKADKVEFANSQGQ